jgi:uncharacterized protein YjbJ (UPF0337 family)
MNEDVLNGSWMELKGKIRQQWGKLTADDVEQIKGNREVLLGKLQKLYGKTRDEVQRDYERWIDANQVKV